MTPADYRRRYRQRHPARVRAAVYDWRRRHPEAFKAHCRRYKAKIKAQRPPDTRRTRTCLRCDRPFPSHGPENRLCPDCKRVQRGRALKASCVG